MAVNLLTKEERERFSRYLDSEAEDSDGIVIQIQKLPADPVMGALVEKYKGEAAACRIVAKMLRSQEEHDH